jgi:uncharacterized membrane protein
VNTPIIMVLLLVGPYLAMSWYARARRHDFDKQAAAAIGLGILFVFTGIGHFVETEPMSLMLPSWVPARVPLIYATGVLELAIALGFFLPATRTLAAGVAAAVLVLFFPANVYAAINRVPMGSHEWGPIYLLIRAPLQLLILLWIYRFFRRPKPRP